MFGDYFAKRRLNKLLAEFTDPKKLNDLERPPIQAGRIEFVFAMVRAAGAEELSKRIGLITDAAHRHGAVVDAIVGPLVVMAFGIVGGVRDRVVSRVALALELQQQLRQNLKQVHGKVDAHFGIFGSEQNRLSYTFTFSGFEAALAALTKLEYGRIEEFVENS